MAEYWDQDPSVENNEDLCKFLLSFRYGRHLEGLLASYKISDYEMQMSAEEVNHCLEMALGKRIQGIVDIIVDESAGYIRKENGEYILATADIGDYEYTTRIDTVEQRGREVIITGEVCVEIGGEEYSYESNSYRCTFEINEESIFAGLTLKEFIKFP